MDKACKLLDELKMELENKGMSLMGFLKEQGEMAEDMEESDEMDESEESPEKGAPGKKGLAIIIGEMKAKKKREMA